MTPHQRAALLSLATALVAHARAEGALTPEYAEGARALRAAMQSGFDVEFAAHPELTELDVRMDALYG